MRKQLFLIMLSVTLAGFGLVRADMTIDGGGGSLELSPTGTLSAGTGAKLTLKNVTIDSLSGNAITGRLIMHHSTSQLVLQNSTLSLALNLPVGSSKLYPISGWKLFFYTGLSCCKRRLYNYRYRRNIVYFQWSQYFD